MRTILTGALCLLLAPAALAASGRARLQRRSGECRPRQDLRRSAAPEAEKRDENILNTLGTALLLGEDQKAKLRDYRDAQAKAIADARSSLCARKPDLGALQGALDLRKIMAQAQLDALNAATPKLLDFYNSLNPEQKAKFDDMRANFGRRSRQ